MKRRHFLQFSGSALAAIGLSQTNVFRQAHRYGQALAQDTPRKLALLVGVNHYPTEGIPSLQGCLTDVRMQYELLVHRFGFNPADIIVVSDPIAVLPAERIMGPPTRQNILTAFEEHLINQAKDGDVVVFHYSGHGSLISDPQPIPGRPQNGTMLPADARPSRRSTEVDDIMGKTLFLLTSALKTDNLTMVLDSCHSGGGTRGGLTYRAVNSRYGTGYANPSATELAYQEQWMGRLNWNEAKLLEVRSQGVAKGIAIGSARVNQYAADAVFGVGVNKFAAGAFTYTLTRYLWQQSVSQSIDRVFDKLALSTRDVANENRVAQEPIYEASPNCTHQCEQQPVYFVPPPTPSAEAVITQVGDEVEFWMGGISSRSLETFTPGAVFYVIDAAGEVIGELEQTDRRGLMGKGKVMGELTAAIAPGLFLRERIRGVPANPVLRVGVDPSLGADMATAEAELAAIDRIEVVNLSGATAVDYIFGRATPETLEQAQQARVANLPPIGSLCLFTPGPLPVSDTWNSDNPAETVTEAVGRLKTRLRMLLAGQILKYVLNTDTSNVQLGTRVVPLAGPGAGGNGGTQVASDRSQVDTPEVRRLQAGTTIELKIDNNEDQGLYVAALVVGSDGDLNILHPLSPDAAEADALVLPGGTLTVPGPNTPPLQVFGPAGFFELLVIASTEPLRDALKALEQISALRGGEERFYALEAEEAVDVMGLLLGDLDRSSRGTLGYQGQNLGVDTTKFAAVSAVLEVVE